MRSRFSWERYWRISPWLTRSRKGCGRRPFLGTRSSRSSRAPSEGRVQRGFRQRSAEHPGQESPGAHQAGHPESRSREPPRRDPSPQESTRMPELLSEVTIYTDGGADPNPGTGGWAAILIDPATGKAREISGGEGRATNNRMELTAAI